MRIDIISVLPEILESPFNHSIIKRAKEKGLAEIYLHNLRDFSEDKHRRVDDYSFGKGAGMVMAIQPIEKAIETLKKAVQRNLDDILAHIYVAACYSSSGRDAEASASAKEVLRINPKFNIESYAKQLPYKNKTDIEREVAALRKAGLK